LQYKSTDYLPVTTQDSQDTVTASTAADAQQFLRTRFQYTRGGQLAKVISPDNSIWSYGYDLFGRQSTTVDPDKGTTTQTYTVLDQVDTTTNNGKTLAYSYDDLGRKTALWSDAARTDATRLAAWGYDNATHGIGLLDTATRYVGGTPAQGGKAYTSRITEFDAMSNPKAQRFTLSASDPLVAAGIPQTMERNITYNLDGTVATATEPAVAGLPKEALSPEYNVAGLPVSLSTPEGIVTGTTYTPLGELRQYGMGETTTTKNQMWVTNTIEAGTQRVLSTDVSDGTHSWYSQNLHYTYVVRRWFCG
jgi:YD repeat-containing protein